MRSSTILGAMLACASAQLMPISEISAIKAPAMQGPTAGKGARSESIVYDTAAVFQSTYNNVFSNAGTSVKRNIFQRRHDGGNCSPQPLGAGPAVSPDTPEAFVADPVFSQTAQSAEAPDGWVNTFKDVKASSQVPMGYLGYESVSSYDPSICVRGCDALQGCFAFDLYYERNPTLDPGRNCTNPPSTTVIKCAYWGTTLSEKTATNDGQYCEDFHIVIAGSNGYQKKAFTVPGYDGTYLGDAAINAPIECDSYIGYQFFSDGKPFDPNRCAAACEAISAYNIQYLNSRAICRFFDTYILNKNGVPQGQYCAMYTRFWDLSYATNKGQLDDQGNQYTISYSYLYSNTTDPGAQICDATCMSQKPCPRPSSSSTTSTMSATRSSSTLTSSINSMSTTLSVISSSTTKLTTTSSYPTTTTPILTTTSKYSSTTLQTTTTKASTTSSSATPTSTQCFKLRPVGPSYLKPTNYLGLDNNNKLSYNTGSGAAIFAFDKFSQLSANGYTVKRTMENWFNPTWGYLSTFGRSSMTCQKAGDGKTLTCNSFPSPGSFWTSKNGGIIANGIYPGNGWDQATLVIEYLNCPTQGENGDWTPLWQKWGFNW